MGGQFTEFRRLLTVHGSVSFCTRNADFVLYFNVFICIKVIDVCVRVSDLSSVSVCVCAGDGQMKTMTSAVMAMIRCVAEVRVWGHGGCVCVFAGDDQVKMTMTHCVAEIRACSWWMCVCVCVCVKMMTMTMTMPRCVSERRAWAWCVCVWCVCVWCVCVCGVCVCH